MTDTPKQWRVEVVEDATQEVVKTIQCHTQRSLHVEFESTSLTLRQWAEKLSLPYASIWYRYNKGVRPPELFLPIGSTGNKTIRRRA